jgi:hypothetical protein
MSAWDIRALLSKVSGSKAALRPGRPSTRVDAPSSSLDAGGAGTLSGRAGRASGLGLSRAVARALGASASNQSGFDRLEERTLLDGSFGSPLPLTDLGGGQFEAANFINPASPSTNNDTFTFTATSTGFVSVLADTRNEAQPNTLNTRVRIFDAAQNLIATGVNNGSLTSGIANDGWAGFVAQNGQSYFIVVDAENTGALTTGNTYTLRVNANNVVFDPTTDIPADPAGDLSRGMGRAAGSPQPIPLPPNPAAPPWAVTPILGELTRLQQDIVYSYTVPTGAANEAFDSVITINAQVTQNDQTIRLDSRLDVYRVTNPVTGAVTNVTSDSDSGRRNDAFTTLRVRPGETIFIRVRSDETRPGVITTGTGTGSFFLVFDGAAADLTNPMNPVLRRGSDPAVLFNGFLDPVAPANPAVPNPFFQTALYRFTAQGTGQAIITFSSTTPANDPAVRLFDDQGNLIAFNNNFVGNAAQLEVQLIGGRRYFIVGDGFQLTTGIDFQLFVEANHTNDLVSGVDDHIDTPANAGALIPEGRQLILKDATGLRFGQPFDTFDADGNLVRDLGQKVRAVGQGRIQGAGDTDLFRFTAPVDMLATLPGNNDDLGTSLFIGGNFDFGGPNQSRPTDSSGLITWDANDYWAVGNQQIVDVGGVPTQLGFVPRAGGAPTAQILALQSFDFDGPGGFGPILFIGGDFTIRFLDADGNLVELDNLVGWFLDPAQGRYTFIDVTGGNPDRPVRTFAIFDPVSYDPDGSGPGATLADPNAGAQPWLAVGGDFTTIGGVAARAVAFFNGAWNPLPGGGMNAAGGVTSVRALAVYDPRDPGPGRTDPAPVIADPIDPPVSLYIGGVFAGGGGTASPNLIRWDGQGADPAGQAGFATPIIRSSGGAWAVNGAVNALTVWNDAGDPDGPGEDGAAGGQYENQSVLIIGGAFTNIGGVAANRVASYGWLDRNADDPASGAAFDPQLDILPLGPGVADGEVFALHVWDPTDESRPGDAVRAPRLLVGGRFNTAGGQLANNIAQFLWSPAGAPIWGVFTDALGQNPGTVGLNPAAPAAPATAAFGTVRAITSFVDQQEPGIPLLDEAPQRALYIGGDFSQITDVPAAGVAARFLREPGGNPDAFGAFEWSALTPQFAGQGLLRDPAAPGQPPRPASVFALAEYDDGNPGQWDRHDRPASRLEIIVAPAEGSFLNSTIRVFDSLFNLVFAGNSGINLDLAPWSTTRGGSSFPFDTSRSGMIDPASSVPTPATTVIGIPVWGGETYYVEVSGQSTGRYTITVVTDAAPTSANAPNPGLNPNDVNAIVVDEPDEGQFLDATEIRTQLGNGEGTNDVGSATQNGGPPPNGNNQRLQKVSPFFGSLATGGDLGNIETIDDTDLYTFRAEFTGTIEIRIQTTLLDDSFGQWLGGEFTNGQAGATPVGTDGRKVYSSQLDSVLRVFRNDFEQIGYNDDNPALQGEFERVFVGSSRDVPGGTPTSFWRRDARVVIPIIAGNFYFLQVESGQRWKTGQPQDPANRTENIDREIDWRYATGSYRVLINQLGDNLLSFVENNVEFRDDYPNAAVGLGSSVPIPLGTAEDGSLNGRGSIAGIINNPPVPLPADDDAFSFIATGSGTVTITLNRTTGSTLNAEVELFDFFGNFLAAGTNAGNGQVRLTRTGVIAGEQFFVVVSGAGGSEGGYTLDVQTAPEVDDFADERNLQDAQDIILRDFTGQGNISGSIEVAGDTDLFRVSAEQFQQFTVTVTAVDATLDPIVFIYEVSEDPAGNPVLLLVNANDDFAPNDTAARTTFSVSPSREKAGPPVRSYPFYYILVGGVGVNTEFGRYNVAITFPPTDDHADGDTNRDGTIDTPADSPRIDEFDFATPITVDSQTGQGAATGQIELVVDSDIFVFTAPAGGPTTITLSRPVDSTLRLSLDVFTADGTLVGSNIGADSTTAPFNAVVTFAAQRGATFFIVARGFEDQTTPNANTTRLGAYTLSVNAQPIDDLPNEGEFTLANGSGVIFISSETGIGTRTAQIGDAAISTFTADTDLLTFVAGVAGSYTVSITPLSVAPLGLAPRVRLISADGTVLQDISAAARRDVVTTASFTATVGQRFYILVNSAASVPGSIGEFEARVTGPTGGSGGGSTDPAVVDLPTAPVINLDSRTGDGSISGIIEVVNDRDAFRFTTFAAGRVFVQVTTPSGSLLNASIRILNAANELVTSNVAFDADGIPGATANVAFNSPANTQYWLIVDGLGDSVGSYTITVNTLPFVNRLVFPEGFTNDIVREFVSIVNPNPVAATYTLYLRYERNLPETIIASTTIGPNARGGVTISDGLNFRSPGVLPNEPYAIVLESDQPLGATLAHYDFGTAIGDSLTEEVSSSWTFANVERNPGSVLDFIVFYNPNAFAVDVTITAFANGQQPVSLTRTFDGLRRGGFSINDIANFPGGTFSVVLSSAATNPANAPQHIGVVASISHYDLATGTGVALLGQASASREGAITTLATGANISSSITLFNPNLTPATVTLTGTYATPNLPAIARTVQVAARASLTLTGAQLGLIADQPAAFVYSSDVPVNAGSSQTQRGDADATRPLTAAGTRFFFGDAFIQRDLAGTQYFETLYFYNPTDRATTVTVSLLFNQGVAEDVAPTDPLFGFRNRSFTVSVPAKSARLVNLHERPEILTRPTTDNFFAIDAQATNPFVMTMTHYDLFLGGGWANDGIPLGIVTPLTLIP